MFSKPCGLICCRYIIDYPNTDPDQHFAVGADTGEVTIRNQLDYETETHQEVHILAIDQGETLTPNNSAQAIPCINPSKLNFQPLEVVSRYRDPQPRVVENYSYVFNLRPNIYKSTYLNSHFISNNSDLFGSRLLHM